MDDIKKALVETPEAKELFDALPPSHQKEYIKWIDEAKKPETKIKRIQKTTEMIREKAGA